MLLNCGVGEYSRVPWTARRSNLSILKEISPEYSLERLMLKLKLNTLATWWEKLTHLKRPWCWERLKAGEVGDDRRWDSWMASPTGWTWVRASSRNWWWTGKPGMLQSMGWQRVRHNCAIELNWFQLFPHLLMIMNYVAVTIWNSVQLWNNAKNEKILCMPICFISLRYILRSGIVGSDSN